MRPASGGFFKVAAIVAAATVGDGVFALPFVFYKDGWLLGLFYLIVLAGFVSAAHVVYLKTLEKIGEKERLLGLAGKYFGRSGFWVGFVAIVLGLILTLVAYLILGTQFVQLAAPSVSPNVAFFVFWLFTAVPIFLNDRRVVKLELVGIACTSAIIVFIFASAWPAVIFAGIPLVNGQNFFLPFGVILFALAGWTSVEPAYESRKKSGASSDPWRVLAAGSFVAALLYTMFIVGILGSTPAATPDTVSGLTSWPIWKKEIIAIFGLLAVATIYLPISHEIKNALEKDLGWNGSVSRFLILFVPLVFIGLGLRSFLTVAGIVGGAFIGAQYLLIVAVGRRALMLSAAKNFFLDLIAVVFAAAAVYEVWTFVVH
jgi:amino acid permease